ncbi:hypothetical protein Pmar_PMAR003271, partial [Perkinsus marinus ATCC 50983]
EGPYSIIEDFLETLLEYTKALHILPPNIKLNDHQLEHIRTQYYPSQAREALSVIRDLSTESDANDRLKRWAIGAGQLLCGSGADTSVTVEQQLLITELLIEVAGDAAVVQEVLINAVIDVLMMHTAIDSELGGQLATGQTFLENFDFRDCIEHP